MCHDAHVRLDLEDWNLKERDVNDSALLCTHIRLVVNFREIKRKKKRKSRDHSTIPR